MRRHLDETKEAHNGRGYEEFVRLLTHGDEFGERLPIAKLARIFNVHEHTMEKWVIIYHEEQARGA